MARRGVIELFALDHLPDFSQREREASEIYPDNNAAALGRVSAMWERVATACTRLAVTVRPSGEKDAA